MKRIGLPFAVAVAVLLALSSAACSSRPPVSPVLDALFTLEPNGETFVRPQDNARLKALTADHADGDVFDAAALGDVPRLRALVGADPQLARKVHPKLGVTPLHLAAFAGQNEAVLFLLAQGAPIDERTTNKFHNTPLILATLARQPETARLLLDQGANVEATEEAGVHPLHLAAEGGDVATLTVLLDHGANLAAKTDAGETALDVARKKNHAEAAAFLRARQDRTTPR